MLPETSGAEDEADQTSLLTEDSQLRLPKLLDEGTSSTIVKAPVCKSSGSTSSATPLSSPSQQLAPEVEGSMTAAQSTPSCTFDRKDSFYRSPNYRSQANSFTFPQVRASDANEPVKGFDASINRERVSPFSSYAQAQREDSGPAISNENRGGLQRGPHHSTPPTRSNVDNTDAQNLRQHILRHVGHEMSRLGVARNAGRAGRSRGNPPRGPPRTDASHRANIPPDWTDSRRD